MTRILLDTVALEALPGWVRADDFQGLVDPDRGSSVVVAEVPGPLSEIVAGLTPSRLENQGIVWLGQETVKFGDRTGRLIHAVQKLGEDVFTKWIGVFGDERQTQIVTGVCPRGTSAALSDELRRIVLSARLDRPDVMLDPPAEGHDSATSATTSSDGPVESTSQPYRIEPAAPLEFCQRVGEQEIYGCREAYPARRADDPLFVVGRGAQGVAPSDREALARERVKHIATTTSVEEITVENVLVDGLEGLEIEARALDAASAEPLRVYQMILFDANCYYLMVGLISEMTSQQWLSTFRETARSFRRAD